MVQAGFTELAFKDRTIKARVPGLTLRTDNYLNSLSNMVASELTHCWNLCRQCEFRAKRDDALGANRHDEHEHQRHSPEHHSRIPRQIGFLHLTLGYDSEMMMAFLQLSRPAC